MSGYLAARLDEIAELTDGRVPYRPIRHHFGITSFGVNAFTAHAPGDRVLNEHEEDEPDEQEELYFVVVGHATFEVDGASLDAPAGTLVRVNPGVRRTAFAREAGTTVLALGATPGKAYVPSGWELWGPLAPLYDAGRYEEAAERGRALLESEPQYPELYYNVACCEALTGQGTAAIAHVRRAIELYEPLRTYAREDQDLAAIREEPAFQELIK